MEKYNQAVLDGWLLLRWHPKLPREPFWSEIQKRLCTENENESRSQTQD